MSFSNRKPIRRNDDRRVKLGMQILEDRCTPASGALSGSIYTITGSNAAVAETITVLDDGTNYSFTASSGQTGTVSVLKASVTSIIVNGRNGDDTINASAVNGATVTLNGGNGNDHLTGSAGNDFLNGNAGNDTIVGGLGDDTINGGAGSDTLYGDSTNTLTISQALAADPTLVISIPTTVTGQNLTSMGQILGVDNNVYTVWRLRNGTGTALTEADLVAVDPNPDVVVHDSLDLPANSDTFVTSPYNKGPDINNPTTPATHIFYPNGTAFSPAIVKAAGPQIFVTDELADQNGGNDTFLLVGSEAEGDVIYGGAGIDTAANQTANAVVLNDFRTTGALGTQTVFNLEQIQGNGLSGGAGSIRGKNSTTDVDVLDFTGLTITGVSSIDLRDGDDQINGSESGDLINGGNGNDVINGGNGNDTLNGGNGNDTLNGGNNNDTLNGNAGTDTLNGGAGDDLLNGGASADILTGGSGLDRFAFTVGETNGNIGNPSLNQDSVIDFTQGTDLIRINNWTTAYPSAPTNPPVVAGTGPSSTGASAEIRYQVVGSDTIIYLPGTGGGAFRRIQLSNFTAGLSLLDFELL